MKKLLLSIIVCVFFVGYSNAQYISAGLKAGGQMANASTNIDDLSTSSIGGFHAGGYFKLKSPLKFGGKIEALYSTKGSNLSSEVPGTNETIESEFRTSHIDIPILLTFNIIKPLAIELGPQMSILTSGETTTNGTSVDYEPRIDPEYGFAVGVDFNLPKKLGIYGRYNLGFNRVDNGQGGKNRINQSWIQLGIKFRLIEPI